MMSLNMVEAKLPPGFRFHPRDDELICDYLVKRVACCDQPPLMIQVDLNKCEPWDIPESACVGGKEYYFYSQPDRKYATGLRTNRATISGYWKATGKDRAVLRKGTLVGMRKTLVFYQGRAPKGRKTDWVMHEFRLEGPLGPPKISSLKEDWVLCRVFFKNRDNILAKEEMNVCDDTGEESSPSTSLPPLMDPYIAFDQTHQNHSTTERQQEQVPYISIFATTDELTHQPNNVNLPFSYLTAQLELLPNLSAKTMPPNFNTGEFSDFGPHYLSSSSSSSYYDQNKVLKAVLNQLTTHDGGPNNVNIMGNSSPSFGEAASTSDSWLSEGALSAMWNNQFSSSP